MSHKGWNAVEVNELDSIAFLSARLGGPLTDPHLALRLNERLGRRPGQPELRHEFSTQKVRRKVEEFKKQKIYPMPHWKTSRECQEMLERVRQEEKTRKEGSKGASRPISDDGTNDDEQESMQNTRPKSRLRLSWSKEEIELLIEEARFLSIFGGYMSYVELAAHLSTFVGPGKRLPSRRGKVGDEFSKNMVNQTVQDFLKDPKTAVRLPNLAPVNSKLKRQRGSDLTTAEEGSGMLSGVISAPAKASKQLLGNKRSAGDVGRPARGASSKRQAHAGPSTQPDKMYDSSSQQSGVPRGVGVPRAHPGHGGAAGMSDVANSMSTLNPYQAREPPQSNAITQARHPTAQNLPPLSQLQPSIIAPVLPTPHHPKLQVSQPFNFPPPPQNASHFQLPPIPKQHPRKPNLNSPVGTSSSQLPPIGTGLSRHNAPSSMHQSSMNLPTKHQHGHENIHQNLPPISSYTAQGKDKNLKPMEPRL